MITPWQIGYICGRYLEGDDFLFPWVDRAHPDWEEFVDGWFAGLDDSEPV